MVDHVKFVMHFNDFMACCNIIIGWTDGWVPLQHIGARAGRPQDWCTLYVATERRHVKQDSLFSATVLLFTSECPLSPGQYFSHWQWQPFGSPVLSSFCGFLCDKKLHRIFSGDISNKMTCSKFWPHIIRGPLSSRGPYARAYRA